MIVVRIKVRLIGSGTPEDPYRVPLPTYTIVEIDYKRKIAVVEVPDELFEEVLPDGTRRRSRKAFAKNLARMYLRWVLRNRNEIKKLKVIDWGGVE